MTQILSIALHAFEAAADFFFGPDRIAEKVQQAHDKAMRLLVEGE